MLIRLAPLTVAGSLVFVDGVGPASAAQLDDLTVGSTVIQLPAPSGKAEAASAVTVDRDAITHGLRAFALRMSRREYEYVPADKYDAVTDPCRRNQIYWREILYPMHLGASIALLGLHQ